MQDALLAAIIFGSLALLGAPLGWLTGVVFRRLRVATTRRLWRRRTTIIAMYDPPKDLRPAEIAFLYDRAFGQEELLATLFDLELRGHITLQPTPAPDGANFVVQLNCKGTEPFLLPFEQEVLLTLKTQNPPTWIVTLQDSTIWDGSIERAVELSLQQRGYFWFPKQRKGWLLFTGIGTLIAGLGVLMPLAISGNWFVKEGYTDPYQVLGKEIGIAIGLFVFVVSSIFYTIGVFLAHAAFCRGMDMERGTPRLMLVWPLLEGFREYLRVVEQSRIQFENETLGAEARQKALPYAVALNMETDWQARFK